MWPLSLFFVPCSHEVERNESLKSRSKWKKNVSALPLALLHLLGEVVCRSGLYYVLIDKARAALMNRPLNRLCTVSQMIQETTGSTGSTPKPTASPLTAQRSGSRDRIFRIPHLTLLENSVVKNRWTGYLSKISGEITSVITNHVQAFCEARVVKKRIRKNRKSCFSK